MEYELKIYDGDLPYIFISYSHKDTERVEQIIHGLQQRGHRIWFDSGIYGGEQWPTYIARRLKQCSAFLLFLSQNYMDSQNCVREIHYALKQNRKILPIYLEQIELDDGLDMQLSYIQALQFTGEQDKQNFWKAIDRVAILKPCRDESADAAPAAPQKVPPAAAPKKDPKPAPQRSIPKARPKNVLMENICEDRINMGESFAFNTELTRVMVESITFLDSLKSAPEDAVDVSLRQDGSVLAWTDADGWCDLCIAAEGGVHAPANSQYLFAGMDHLTEINFNGAFFTENATTMHGMFEKCSCLTELDLSSFDTTGVTDMSNMFSNCWKLTELNLSSFDTSNVTDMSWMFAFCSELTDLELSKFDTSNVQEFLWFMDKGKTVYGWPWEELFSKG